MLTEWLPIAVDKVKLFNIALAQELLSASKAAQPTCDIVRNTICTLQLPSMSLSIVNDSLGWSSNPANTNTQAIELSADMARFANQWGAVGEPDLAPPIQPYDPFDL